ncbi:MAG: MarR family transcriptional regulator [Rhodospirillales bacterium]|nr:MarR family transcriptional regulator [Rhodospirillales bacterium]
MALKTSSLKSVPDAVAIPGGHIPRLDQQLCFALYSAVNRVTRLYRPVLAALGLTYPQYLAMLALWERSPRTVGALGEALELDSGTITPLLKRLEKQDLVRRRRDPVDERRVIVELTAAGQALRVRAAEVPASLACRIAIPQAELIELGDRVRRFKDHLAEDGGALSAEAR